MNEIYIAAKLFTIAIACMNIGNATQMSGWKDDEKWGRIIIGMLFNIASVPVACYAVFHLARAIIGLTIFAK